MDPQRIEPPSPVPPAPVLPQVEPTTPVTPARVPPPVKRDDEQRKQDRTPAPKRRDSGDGEQTPRVDEYV